MGLFKPNIDRLAAKKKVKGLIKILLKSKEKFDRMAAADALGKIKDVRAVEPLIEALKDEAVTGLDDDWYLVIDSASDALGKIGDSRGIEPLLELLKDKRFSSYAANALGDFKNRRAKDALNEYKSRKKKNRRKSFKGDILEKCGGCGSDIQRDLKLVTDKKNNHGYLCTSCNQKYAELLKPNSIRNFWMCNDCKFRVLAGTEIDAKIDSDELNGKCPNCYAELMFSLVNLKGDKIIESGIAGEPLE